MFRWHRTVSWCRSIEAGLDFLKLLRSFEELLFEVMTWFIYYPRTMWLTITHPLRMIDYSDHELKEGVERQYTDALSPPLLLLITLAVVHFTELGLNLEHIHPGSEVAKSFISSDQNLIIMRSFLFGLLPLFAALCYVRKRGLSLERKNLRPAFFGQCYLAAAYALMVSLSYIVSGQRFAGAAAIGTAVLVVVTLWYLYIQALQFIRSLATTSLTALILALKVYLQAFFFVLIIALIVTGGTT